MGEIPSPLQGNTGFPFSRKHVLNLNHPFKNSIALKLQGEKLVNSTEFCEPYACDSLPPKESLRDS